MVNFMDQLDWALGPPDSWLNIILSVSVRIFLDEIDNGSRLRSITWWASPNQSKALHVNTKFPQRRNSALRLQHQLLATVFSLLICPIDFGIASPTTHSRVSQFFKIVSHFILISLKIALANSLT